MACSLGGIIACGATHTVVTPLDVVKCNMQVGAAAGSVLRRRSAAAVAGMAAVNPTAISRAPAGTMQSAGPAAMMSRDGVLDLQLRLRLAFVPGPLGTCFPCSPADGPQELHRHRAGLPQDCGRAGHQGAVPRLGAHRHRLLGAGRVQGARPTGGRPA